MSLLNISFETTDFQGNNTLSSYALPQCPFTFSPQLSSNQALISTTKVLWDFGDQSTSTDIKPVHSYKWPGIYTITLVVYDINGEANISSYSPSVSVVDFLPNQLIADTIDTLSFDVPAGQITPFRVTRSNSWQTYQNLSGSNYTVNLYVSGSLDPLVDVGRYYDFGWSHLAQQSYFYNKQIAGSTYEYVPVSSIETTTDLIYAVLDKNNNISICSPTVAGSFFVGTTGMATPYFTSNKPKHYNSLPPPLIIFCSLDTSFIEDFFTDRINYFAYNTQPIGYLNTSPAVLYTYSRYNPAASLDFSTNGIDTRSDAILSAFEIPAISWQNTNIPFVAKLNDNNNFSTLFYPLLSSNVANQTITSPVYNIQIVLLSGATIDTAVNATFHAEFLKSLPPDVGGYFKGYFTSPYAIQNATLSAAVTVTDPSFYQLNTVETIHPSTSGLTVFSDSDIIQSQGNTNSRIFELVPNVYSSYYGVTFAVAPSCNYGFKQNAAWGLSADGNHIFTMDYNGNMLSAFNILNILNQSLSATVATSVAIDGNADSWTALLTAASAMKLDGAGNLLALACYPDLPINNNYNLDPQTLYAVSALPLVAPRYLETDKENNIWVSNINPAYNYLVKYDSNGNYITSVFFGDIALPDKIVIDGDDNVWVVVLGGNGTQIYGPLITIQSDISGNFPIMTQSGREFYALSADTVSDTIVQLDKDGNSLHQFGGFIRPTSLAYDLSGNVWVAHNQHTLTKIDIITNLTTDYHVGSAFTNPVLQALFNLTCNTYNKLSMYNEADNSLYLIDAANPSLSAQYPQGNNHSVALTANDDINGYRWITKYAKVPSYTRTLTGISNSFTIYPDSGTYNVAKQNEDFNMQGYFATLQIPEYLIGKNIMFKDFLGSIFGAASAEPYELGKTLYERVANFGDNHNNIDTATVEALISLSKQTGASLADVAYNYPAQLRRIVDILSVKHSKLYGNNNQFNQSFSDANGLKPYNRGAKLDISTDTFSLSETLVSFERFSRQYKAIKLPALSGVSGNTQYSFTTYTSAWNLPVVLMPSITGLDVGLYYDFYRYNDVILDNILDSVINWKDPMVTLNHNVSSYSDWIIQDGIMDNILNYELSKGLRLFTSAVDIVYNG